MSPAGKQKASRAEQKAATRAKLLKVARRVFAKHGFDGSSIALVCSAARLTHGALYHHFRDKDELFTAVLEAAFADISDRVLLASTAEVGWQQVEAACAAYLGACSDAEIQRIVFRDGPRVLARAKFDAIDHAANAPLVTGLLQRWMEAGLLEPQPVNFLARTLGAAFAEAGLLITEAEAPLHAQAELGAVLGSWVSALRRRPTLAARVLASERIKLTPITDADSIAYAEAVGSAVLPVSTLLGMLEETGASRSLAPGRKLDLRSLQALLSSSATGFRSTGLGVWLAHAPSKEILGLVGFLPEGEQQQLLVWLQPKWRNRGHGFELAQLVLREALARGSSRIVATAAALEPSASRFLARLGFVRLGQRQLGKEMWVDYALAR